MNKTQNDITDLPNYQQQVAMAPNTEVNFSIQNPKSAFEEESTKARETALENHIAGIPLIDQTIKTQPTITQPTVTSSFTTRDEIMSHLGLMDENFNYTDTYTNYIQKGGSPLPGYEYAHEELLKQEHYDQIFQQVEDGTLSYDQALLEAYGKDIMATMGYDVTSTAYWQNKFKGNDFSNPFTNRYLMDQVKQAAEEYHQARQVSNYARSNTQQSQMAGLVGKEIAAEKIDDLFPDLGRYAEEQNISDQELRKMITANQIPASARIIQATPSSYYYLHTDGKLHILDNKEGHGSFKLDEEGKIKSISLNGSEFIDVTRHILSGAASVFTGLFKIGAMVTSIPEALFTDDSYLEALTGQIASIDSFCNDSELLNKLTDSGTIDMDGFKVDDASDWIFAVSDIAGMIIGGYGLGSAAGLLSKGGTALTTSSNILVRGAGRALRFTGNLAARSTGMYSGAKGFDNRIFSIAGHQVTKSAWAPFLNHTLKTVPTYAIKDFYTTVQALNTANIQAQLNGEDVKMTEADITSRALQISLINAGISSIFAGGINDNQTQRLGLSKIIDKRTGADSVLKKVSKSIMSKGTEQTQKKLLSKLTNKQLASLLTSRRVTIAINTTMDLVDNFLTMNIQDALSHTKQDGELVSFKEAFTGYETDNGTHYNPFLAPENSIRNLVSAAMMTAPTLKGNLGASEYSIPLQELNGVHKNILALFDQAIEKNPKNKEALKLVKQNYITDYTSNKGTVEENILYAMDNLANNLGGKKVPKIIDEAIGQAVSATKNAFYKELYAQTEAKRLIHRQAVAKTFQEASNAKGGIVRQLLTKAASKLVESQTGLSKNAFKTATSNSGFKDIMSVDYNRVLVEAEINKKITPIMKAYEELTQSGISNSLIDKLKYDPKEINFDGAIKYTAFEDLKMDDQLRNDIAANIPSQPENYMFVRIKNEAGFGGNATFSDRMKANLFKTSMDILSNEENSLYVKVNDEYYAMPITSSAVTQAFTLDTTYKYNMALMEISKGNRELGLDILVSTYLGDKDYKNEENLVAAGNHILDTLNTAVTNNVIDEVDAVSTLYTILNEGSPSSKVKKALAPFKAITDLKLKNSIEAKDLSPLEKQYKVLNAINEVAKISGDKKLFTSEKQQAAINLLYTDDRVPREEVLSFIKAYNSKYAKDIDLDKFSEAITKAYEGEINPYSSASHVEKVLDRLALKPLQDNDLGKHYSYNYALPKEILKEITDTQKGIFKNCKQMSFDGNKVIINHAFDFGKALQDAKTKIETDYRTQRDKPFEKLGLNYSEMAKEFRNNMEANPHNRAIEVFDLDTIDGMESFKAVADKLNLFESGTKLDTLADVKKALVGSIRKENQGGLTYKAGAQDVIFIPGVDVNRFAKETIKVMKEYVADIFEIDTLTGKTKKIDMISQIRSAVKLDNLSPSMIKRFKSKGIKGIIPFISQDKYSFSNLVDVLIDTDEKATKQGTLAGNLRNQFKQQAAEALTATVESDPDLSKYFAVKALIETMDSSPLSYSFRINSKFRNRLTDLGIIGPEGFYEITPSDTADTIVLHLKENAKELMTTYLDKGTEFNLYKFIPMITDSKASEFRNYYQHPIIQNGKFTFNDESVDIPSMYKNNGIHQGFDAIMNISFSWDHQNKLKNEIIFNLAKNVDTFRYNPFENKPENAIKQLETLYESNKEKFLGIKPGHDAEDYKAWLRDEKFLRKLNQEYIASTLSSVTAKDIIDIYTDDYKLHGYRAYTDPADGGYFGAVYNLRGSYVDGLQMSGDVLARAYDLDFEPIDSSGRIYSGAEVDITKAIEEFKSKVNMYEDYRNYLTLDTSNIHMFQETPITKLLQGVGGTNGYFTIDDVDYINKITEKQWLALYEKASIPKAEVIKMYKGLKEIAKKFINYSKIAGSTIESTADGAKPRIIFDGKNIVTDDEHFNEDIKTGTDLLKNKRSLDVDHERVHKLADNTTNNGNKLYKDAVDKSNTTLDTMLRDRFASPANVNVLNLQDVRGFRAEGMIVNNTVTNIQSMLDDSGFKINIKDKDLALNKLAKDFYVSAGGTDKWLSEFQAYKIVDESLKPIASLTKAKNPFEIYDALNNMDLNNKMFIQLDSHDLLSNDGVKFKYTYLDTPEKIKNLKEAFLLDGIDALYSKYRNKYSNKEEYKNFLQHLPEGELQAIVDNYTRTNLSKLSEQNIVINNVSNITGINIEDLRRVLIKPVYKNPTYNNEAIQNTIKGISNMYFEQNEYIKAQQELADFGITKNALNQVQLDAIAEMNSVYSKKLDIQDPNFYKGINDLVTAKTEKDFNKAITNLKKLGYSMEDVIKGYIINSNSGAVLSYKVRRDERIKNIDNEAEKVVSLNTFTGKKVLVKDIQALYTNEDGKKLIVLDFEGETKKAIKNYKPEEVFQIGIKVYNGKSDDPATNVYYIVHKDINGKVIEPADWVKNNIDTEMDFFKNNPAFRKAIKEYSEYKNKEIFKSFDEIIEMLGEGNTIMAFNGNNYDFKFLDPKKNTLIDAMELISVMNPGDEPLNRITQSNVAEKFIKNTEDAHNAGNDVSALSYYIKDTINIITDISINSKKELPRMIDSIASMYGIEDTKSLYNELDDFFKNTDVSYNGLMFNKIDASDSAKIKRTLNFLEKDDLGYLLRNFERDEVYKQLNINNLKKDFIQNKQYLNLSTNLAKLLTFNERTNPEYTTANAFRDLMNIGYQKFNNDLDGSVGDSMLFTITDRNLLSEYDDILSDPKFMGNKKSIEENLKKGLSGNTNPKYGLNAADIDEYKLRGNVDTILFGLSDAYKNLGIDESEIKFLISRDMQPISVSDAKILDNKQQLLIQNKDAKRLLDLIDNNNESLIISKHNGIYSMIAPLNPEGEQMREITINKINGKASKNKKNIKYIDPSEIILTEAAAIEINNGKPIETLFDSNGEAWIYSLAHPSDKQSHLLAHKLRIVEGNNIRVFATPQVMEVLRARDFDGDFLTIFPTTSKAQKEVARISSKYLYRAHKLQEDLFRQTMSFAQGKPQSFVEATRICQDSEILRISKALDQDIKLGNDTKANEDELRLRVEALSIKYNFESEVDDVYKHLGISKDSGKDFRYVMNPAIWMDPTTESYLVTKKYGLHVAGTKTNLSDSTLGYFKKWKMHKIVPEMKITNPLSQLNSTDIMLSNSMVDAINKITSPKQINDMLNTVSTHLMNLKSELNNIEFSEAIDSLLKDTEIMRDSISPKIDSAKFELKHFLNDTLQSIEYAIRVNKDFNKEVLNILETMDLDNSFYAEFNRKKILKEELKDKANKVKTSLHGSYSKELNTESAVAMSKWLTSLANESSRTFKEDISEVFKGNKGRIGILIDDADAEDVILINQDTNKYNAEIHEINIKDGYKITSLPSELNKNLEGILTKEQANNFIQGAKFNSNVYIKDIIFEDQENPSPETISYVRVVELRPLWEVKNLWGGKGVGKKVKINSDEHIDALLSNKIWKNAKIALSSRFKILDDQIKTISIDVYDKGKIVPKKKKVLILDEVPAYNVMNDNQFNMDNPKKIDFMTFLGSADNLAGLGMFGTTLYDNSNGLVRTDKHIQKILEDRNNGFTACYSNAVHQVQFIRTKALAKIFDRLHLWQNPNVKQVTNATSGQDLMNRFLHNPYIATDKYQSQIKALKNFIEPEVFNRELQKLSKEEQAMFSPTVEKLFNKFNSSNLYEFETDGEVKMITSKNKAKESVRNLATESLNTVENKSTKDTLISAVRDTESYYIPYSMYYELLTGRRLSDWDILQATKNGVFQAREHYNGESSIDGGFKPVDKIYSTRLDDVTADRLYMNDLKNGMGGYPDYVKTESIEGNKHDFVYTDSELSELETLPKNLSLYQAIYDNFERPGRNKTGYARTEAHLGYILENLWDVRNKNDVDRALSIVNREVDPEILMQLVKKTWTAEDGETLYKAKDFITKELFSNLTDAKRYSMNVRLNKYNYYTHSEIYNKKELGSFKGLKDTVKKYKTQDIKVTNDDIKDLVNIISDSYNKSIGAVKNVDFATKGMKGNIKFTFDAKGTTEAFKNSVWTGSGIKIEGPDTMAINVALKNYGASAEYAKLETTKSLAKLNSLMKGVNSKAFQDFCVYNWLQASKNISDETLRLRADYAGYKIADLDTSLKDAYNKFTKTHPEVASAYNEYVSNMMKLVKNVESSIDEPFGNITTILAPFRSDNKELNYGTVYNAIKSNLNFNSYDPAVINNTIRSNMVFNFFDSANSMINQLSRLVGIKEISTTLEKQGLLDNVSIVDKAYEYLTNIDACRLYMKVDDPVYEQANEDILNVIKNYTSLNVSRIIKGCKYPGEKFQRLYKALEARATETRQRILDETGEYVTLSSAKRGMNTSTDMTLRKLYSEAYNDMWTQIIVAQRILEISPKAMKNATEFVSGLKESGYSLCNKYGQKISMDSPIRPLAESSMKFLADNVELYYNNSNPEKFAQYVIEKALSGDIYLAKTELVDQLEDKVYTQKVPNKIISKLMDISKMSSSLQMSMPTKMISRLARFTGFDYIMGAIYNPNSIKYAPQAAKEIMQAVHTDGKSVVEGTDLYDYFIREGQPIGVKGKDAVTFSEDMNSKLSNITDILTNPLQVQNHLGRYAIYLAAKKSFDEGDPWYGPVYKYKDEIDSIGDNADKAMFVMDYILGSPGGFPYLSKKTSGLMMYSTFPLNLTRTMGAWGMSIGRLAQEGFTSENAKHWMINLVYPSLGVFAATAVSNLMISYICDLYNVDEETEEDWKEKGVWIDPFGTVLGDSPSVVYDSVIPTKNLKEMFIEPFTSEYNKTAGDKLLGLFNANITSRLNPVIKNPIEIVSKKDVFGTSLYDTSNIYSYWENTVRKTLGFFAGSGVANNVIDQMKIDEYNEDSSFIDSIWKGISKGFSSDLGNQKSWKKQTSNYYAAISSVRNFYNATNNNTEFDADAEDLVDIAYLDKQRDFSKYGEYNKDDFSRVNTMLRKMIKGKESSAVIYAYIAEEYNKGTSEATLRAVLNNNSIIRKLSKIDINNYYKTLSGKELEMIAQAIQYEEETYPLLQEFFPTSSGNYSGHKYLPKRKSYYGSGSGKTYIPTPRRYYPSFVYPSNSSYNKKYKSYSPYAHIDREDVNVSPQMAIWKNDYNAIEDLDKEEWYLNNPFYNNLSDWEKRQKGGNN